MVPSLAAGAKRIRSGAGMVVGVEDRLTKRPPPLSARFPTVKVLGESAILEAFDTEPDGWGTLRKPCGAVSVLRTVWHQAGTRGPQPG